MYAWRWWQIQGLDFTWLTGARNSVMHHRKTIFLSCTLSGFGDISLITLRPSESQVKTFNCKYISPFLGSVLEKSSFFKRIHEHNSLSVISKKFNASNESNLLSSWCFFSFSEQGRKNTVLAFVFYMTLILTCTIIINVYYLKKNTFKTFTDFVFNSILLLMFYSFLYL